MIATVIAINRVLIFIRFTLAIKKPAHIARVSGVGFSHGCFVDLVRDMLSGDYLSLINSANFHDVSRSFIRDFLLFPLWRIHKKAPSEGTYGAFHQPLVRLIPRLPQPDEGDFARSQIRMPMKNTCGSDHRYFIMFAKLPECQGDVGRHKCAGCAYELGKRHAQKGIACATGAWVLGHLPESQAGTVRHKDAFTAYLMGYKDGCAMLAIKKVA